MGPVGACTNTGPTLEGMGVGGWGGVGSGWGEGVVEGWLGGGGGGWGMGGIGGGWGGVRDVGDWWGLGGIFYLFKDNVVLTSYIASNSLHRVSGTQSYLLFRKNIGPINRNNAGHTHNDHSPVFTCP